MVSIANKLPKPVQLAEKTLTAIEEALAADNCGQYRQQLRHLLPKMEDAYRGEEKPYRNHQGASGIGDECARKVQLRWRWVQIPTFPPRVLRLFNRGHLEEARFLSLLMCIPNVQLWYETETGGQIKWSTHAGHYGSALDGVAVGLPDVPNGAPTYTEFKTANNKGFQGFVKDGCRMHNMTYFVQTQQCMKYMNLQYTLFMVVNKETDELYAEIIEYDAEIADKYSGRAENIIYTTEALPRLSNMATFWKCRFCDVKEVCHGKTLPEINCRTCCHWSASREGGYTCERGRHTTVNSDTSHTGCKEHVYDPTLLPSFEFLGGNEQENYTVLRTKGGFEFKQGPDHITSIELKSFGAKYEG